MPYVAVRLAPQPDPATALALDGGRQAAVFLVRTAGRTYLEVEVLYTLGKENNRGQTFAVTAIELTG